MANGKNVQRQAVGGDTTNQIGGDIRDLSKTGSAPLLQRAVVVDVITDPDLLTEEELDAIASTVSNAELVDVMPYNSVIGRISSNNAGGTSQANIILFPFFSSHVMMPVQPGETVYVLFEDYEDTGTSLGYWFTRVHTCRTVEDVNYTHLDRRFDPSNNPANYSTEERSRTNEEGSKFLGPGFPNGGNTTQSRTLEADPTSEEKIEPYEQIKKESKTYVESIIEPVPRWRKRAQEYVLQGCNNTLMFFGRDRGGPVVNPDDAKGQSGTIGLIVGRGRSTSYKAEGGDEVPEGTAPRVIKNTREEFETDKAAYRRGRRRDNPNEGNPDFINDAAMSFVTMQSEVDRRFNLKVNPVDSLNLPDITGEGTFNRSHCVEKADHLRFVARKDTAKGVKGTILFVREGEEDEDLGYFFIDEDGKIQIEATKIYLGKSTKEAEPYIKYTEFVKAMGAMQRQINSIQTACNLAIGNLGAPVPSLAALDTAEDRGLAGDAVRAAPSKKIFGE